MSKKTNSKRKISSVLSKGTWYKDRQGKTSPKRVIGAIDGVLFTVFAGLMGLGVIAFNIELLLAIGGTATALLGVGVIEKK